MAMDIITWILMGGIAGLLFVVVLFMYLFIQPARNSPAKFFIEAKRKKKPLAILDGGGYWIFEVAQKEAEGYLEDKKGSPIMVAPNSLKYGLGVRMGVGEAHRNILVNPAIIKMLEIAKNNKIEAKEIRQAIEQTENTIRQELDDYGKQERDTDRGNRADTGQEIDGTLTANTTGTAEATATAEEPRQPRPRGRPPKSNTQV